MLIAAFIFVMSAAAAIQFAVSSWRAGLIRATAGAPALEVSNAMNLKGFQDVTAYQNLCPKLGSSSGPGLRSVRLYHSLMTSLRGLGADWASGEMALCTRYATAVLSQRVEHNQALLADVRSC
jgi:hypothetical protein